MNLDREIAEVQALLREIRRNEAFARAAGHDVETYHLDGATVEQRSN